MTLKEKEIQLTEDIVLFNKNIEWWKSEIDRVNFMIAEFEKNNLYGQNQKKIDGCVKQLTYLLGKANTENKTATKIGKKMYKLILEKDLRIIQGKTKNEK